MVRTEVEMIYTVPLTDINWMNIVDHYFDSVHWIGEERNNQFETPSDWIWQEYGAKVDMTTRQYFFYDEQKRNWFTLRWI